MKIIDKQFSNTNYPENADQTSYKKTNTSVETVTLQAVFQKYLEHTERYEEESKRHLLTWACFR